MPAKSLEWITPSSDDTIQGWIDNLIKCGLLIEDELVSSYYATQRLTVQPLDDDANYTYTQIYKEISREEYTQATKAYSDCLKDFGNISKNPDVAFDEAIFQACLVKKATLDGWWAMKKKSFKTSINEEWEHLPQLRSLLEKYDFKEYIKEKPGNYLEDEKMWEEREKKWAQEREEKRKKLAEQEIKPVEEAAEVEEPRYKELQKELEDMPIVDNFRDYLVYIHENIIKTKKEIGKYYV